MTPNRAALIFTLILVAPIAWAQNASSVCENAVTRTYTRDNNPIAREHEKASRNIQAIQTAVASLPSGERGYFAKIQQAVEAALGKHHQIFMNESQWRKLDLQRHFAILKAIADFSPSEAHFSLYRIKRAIEGRHSLNDYIHCRE